MLVATTHMDAKATPTNDTDYSCYICDTEQPVEKRDLGVVMDNQLKFHDNSVMAVGKARRLLGLISNSSN